MIPVKVPEEVWSKYPKEDKIEMDYLPRKIVISGEEEQADCFIIQKQHLDCNDHVNNGQYIKMASVYLPQDFVIGQMRAEYKSQARLGDMVYPYVYKEEMKVIICLCNQEKKPYVVVEFQKKI